MFYQSKEIFVKKGENMSKKIWSLLLFLGLYCGGLQAKTLSPSQLKCFIIQALEAIKIADPTNCYPGSLAFIGVNPSPTTYAENNTVMKFPYVHNFVPDSVQYHNNSIKLSRGTYNFVFAIKPGEKRARRIAIHLVADNGAGILFHLRSNKQTQIHSKAIKIGGRGSKAHSYKIHVLDTADNPNMPMNQLLAQVQPPPAASVRLASSGLFIFQTTSLDIPITDNIPVVQTYPSNIYGGYQATFTGTNFGEDPLFNFVQFNGSNQFGEVLSLTKDTILFGEDEFTAVVRVPDFGWPHASSPGTEQVYMQVTNLTANDRGESAKVYMNYDYTR